MKKGLRYDSLLKVDARAISQKKNTPGQPDSLKPVLDKIMDKIISSFSEKDRDFYEMEFGFFKEVTGISGKLKPLVQAGAKGEFL